MWNWFFQVQLKQKLLFSCYIWNIIYYEYEHKILDIVVSVEVARKREGALSIHYTPYTASKAAKIYGKRMYFYLFTQNPIIILIVKTIICNTSLQYWMDIQYLSKVEYSFLTYFYK